MDYKPEKGVGAFTTVTIYPQYNGPFPFEDVTKLHFGGCSFSVNFWNGELTKLFKASAFIDLILLAIVFLNAVPLFAPLREVLS